MRIWFAQLLGLEDREDQVNPKVSEETLEYVSSLKSHLKQVFEKASFNRDIIMTKSKTRHDRKIKEFRCDKAVLASKSHTLLGQNLPCKRPK